MADGSLPPGRYLLLRVESRGRTGSARPVRTFPTLQEAKAAAAELPRQPTTRWSAARVAGVWQQIDWTGQGFVIHRIDHAESEPAIRP